MPRRYLHVYSAVDPGTGLTFLKRTDDGTAGGQSWWIGMLPMDAFLGSINQGILIVGNIQIADILNGNTGYFMTPYVANYDPSSPAATGTHGNPDYSGYKLAREQFGKPVQVGGSDLSGSETLIENFLRLMDQLIASFSRKGDKRTVGILKFFLDQFLSGKQSVIDILDQLHKMFIV